MPQTELELSKEQDSALSTEFMHRIYIDRLITLKVNDAFDWIFSSRGGHGYRFKNFWHCIFGFDITNFDDLVIHSREGESITEAVERQYGIMGVNLIWLLLSSKEDKQKYLDSVECQLDHSSQWYAFKAGTLRFGNDGTNSQAR